MSDGTWDAEYDKRDTLIDKIVEFCEIHKIEMPELGEYPRSWELEKILKKLQDEVNTKEDARECEIMEESGVAKDCTTCSCYKKTCS